MCIFVCKIKAYSNLEKNYNSDKYSDIKKSYNHKLLLLCNFDGQLIMMVLTEMMRQIKKTISKVLVYIFTVKNSRLDCEVSKRVSKFIRNSSCVIYENEIKIFFTSGMFFQISTTSYLVKLMLKKFTKAPFEFFLKSKN